VKGKVPTIRGPFEEGTDGVGPRPKPSTGYLLISVGKAVNKDPRRKALSGGAGRGMPLQPSKKQKKAERGSHCRTQARYRRASKKHVAGWGSWGFAVDSGREGCQTKMGSRGDANEADERKVLLQGVSNQGCSPVPRSK